MVRGRRGRRRRRRSGAGSSSPRTGRGGSPPCRTTCGGSRGRCGAGRASGRLTATTTASVAATGRRPGAARRHASTDQDDDAEDRGRAGSRARRSGSARASSRRRRRPRAAAPAVRREEPGEHVEQRQRRERGEVVRRRGTTSDAPAAVHDVVVQPDDVGERASSRAAGRRQPPSRSSSSRAVSDAPSADDGELDHLDAGDERGRRRWQPRSRAARAENGERGAVSTGWRRQAATSVVPADGDQDDRRARASTMSPERRSTRRARAGRTSARGWSVVRTRASAVVSSEQPRTCDRGRRQKRRAEAADARRLRYAFASPSMRDHLPHRHLAARRRRPGDARPRLRRVSSAIVGTPCDVVTMGDSRADRAAGAGRLGHARASVRRALSARRRRRASGSRGGPTSSTRPRPTPPRRAASHRGDRSSPSSSRDPAYERAWRYGLFRGHARGVPARAGRTARGAAPAARPRRSAGRGASSCRAATSPSIADRLGSRPRTVEVLVNPAPPPLDGRSPSRSSPARSSSSAGSHRRRRCRSLLDALAQRRRRASCSSSATARSAALLEQRVRSCGSTTA